MGTLGSIGKRSLREKRCEWKKGKGQRERKWKGREGKGREGKGREGKGREGKGRKNWRKTRETGGKDLTMTL